MDYECNIVPFDKIMLSPAGIYMPLCNDCHTPDCSNPIREQLVSIMGKNVKMRLWTVNNQARMVVFCKGYVGDKDVSLGSDEK